MKTIFFNFLEGIKKNYKTVIVSFIIACVLWVAVSVLTFDTINNRINGINVTAQPTDYMAMNNLQITSDITDKVNIQIEGKRYDISDLGSSDFSAEVDLSSVRSAGTYTLPLKVDRKTSRDLAITSINPEQISVTIDEIISKEFPITGAADVIPANEYYLGEITATPATITLTGSSTLIGRVVRVEAVSTLHGNISESQQTGSEIKIYGAGNRVISEGLTLSTDSVRVDIPIFKQKELPLKFQITNYPSNFDINSLKYKIVPEKLTVATPDSSIDNLSELDIGTVDLSDIKLTTTSYITIALPDGYKNLSGNVNARIEWDMEEYGQLDFTVTNTNENDNIKITNSPTNFDVSLVTNSLKLTLIGPSERLAEILPSDITVTANLFGTQLHEGLQDVSVSVQIKGSRQSCWASGEYKVTINASPVTESGGA